MPSLAIRRRQLALAATSLIGLSLVALPAAPTRAEVPTVVCGFDGNDLVNILPQPGPGVPPDLVVNGPCQVTTDSSTFKGTWKFRRVNIIDGGVLEFVEKKESETDFWAHGIVIENGGKMIAGRATQAPAALPGNAESGGQQQPVLATPSGRAFGELGGRLRIHLYGEDQSKGDPRIAGQGTPCRSQEFETGDNPCGIDDVAWKSNGSQKVVLANGIKDYFYQYDPLYVDTKTDEQGRQGYFGYKSIGLAYGGSLELYGAKGSLPPLAPDQKEDPTDSGNSWIRLGATLIPSYKQDGKDVTVNVLKLDRAPGAAWPAARWQAGDEIVVTTTDYLATHSEQLTIEKLEGDLIVFRRSDCAAGQTTDGCPGVRWRHQGTRYPLSNRLDKALGPDGQPRLTIDLKLVAEGVETRAAVALLTRSIRILSAGDTHEESFEQATARNPSYAFGGHLVVRQGFRKMQVQGVEFKQLGQGGRKGHYPVHFHMARLVPNESWIKDSSINESMTRWIVVHSTQNLTIARNVGYLSIGHGFYLEDSTEIDNRFHSNIGIHARAAVDSDANPRRIPGILIANNKAGPDFPYLSDGLNPSVFWITNNWNDFIGNAAVGAGTCGACYWVVPSYSEQNGHHGMKWEGYAALQRNPSLSGATPMKSFYKNSCTSAMNAIMTVDGTAACNGVSGPGGTSSDFLNIIKSTAPTTNEDLSYYPKFTSTPHATTCPVAATQDNPGLPTTYDCNNAQVCANGKDNCAVTVIDHFTTSFNWSAYNFSAVWLRQFWYLFDNSAITDTLSAGITFVSGGDYTKSSSPEGYWALASNSLFVGETQPDNPLAWSIGPVNASSGLRCQSNRGDTCVLRRDGMIILKSNWGVNQRFFNIYDGPNYQESNAYLDIKTRPCTQQNGCLWAATNLIGVRNDPAKGENAGCYAPNAAIAWKQPNGFYYPPAFHSTNLYFDNVDIRHYVIAPVFKPVGAGDLPGLVNFGQGGSYLTDIQTAKLQYCYFPPNGFDTFTDIDRQTELNDDDGSLTGLARTISVNEDPFFNAPVETSECKSNVGVDPVLACNGQPTPKSVDSTAKTSPYDYVTTVIVPANCANGGCPSSVWDSNCGGPYCYGVPIFRQFLVGSKAKETGEWAHWAHSGCYIADGGVARAACRWPFLRMAGQNTWQRSNMTANYGSYYIDTSISEATQRNEKFTTSPEGRTINVFEAGKPYSLMFLFVKNTTRQTYQVYVGKDFKKDQDVRPVRGRILTNPTTFSPADNAGNWLTTEFADGLLTIKVDFANVKDLTPNQANGMCRPHGFCDTDVATGACGCSLKDNDPLVLANPGIKATCVRACGNWAVKDLDCPIGGCYAVSFTMSADFKADDIQHRPQPQEFPGPTAMSLNPGSGDRGWETLFSRTATLPDGKSGGTCYYDKLPGTAECVSPP